MKNLNPYRHVRFVCLGLCLLTLVLYLPSLHHDFLVFDDQQYVTENPEVQAGITSEGFIWAFGYHASNWHPVTWLSHMLDCQLYGLKPAGHHLTNLLLHTANAGLLFLMLFRLTGAVWRSAIVGALFAWHPLHVESVAWIAERKDVLSGFFWMLTILAYARYVEAGKLKTRKAKIFYSFCLMFFVMGLMAKAMVVTLPCVMLLLDFWPLKRLNGEKHPLKSFGKLVLEKTPFIALAGVVSLLTVEAQRRGDSMVSIAGISLSHRISQALVSYLQYLRAMAAPFHLAVYYPSVKTIAPWLIFFSFIILALITTCSVLVARRRPYVLVGWLWYLGTLVPVIGLVQVGEQAWADRYSYLPSIGIFIILVWGMAEVFQSMRGNPPDSDPAKLSAREKRGFLALGLTAGITLAFLTSRQLNYWKNTWTLFEHTERVTYHNYRAVTILGSLLASEGKLEEAKSDYRRALSWNPDFPEAHFFLGNALDRQGDLDEAISEYHKAAWYKPIQEQDFIYLGEALAKQSKIPEAIAQYQSALKANPKSAVAHNNLAKLLHLQGDLDGAIEHYYAALKSNPKLAQARNNLGILLLQKGDFLEGGNQLREAFRLNPGDPETEYNLALALNQQGQWETALDHFTRTVGIKIENPSAHYQFGLALAKVGKTREALGHFARAIILKQDFPEALDQISWILATSPQNQLRNGAEAVRMAESACALTGTKQPPMLATLAAAYAEVGRFEDAVTTGEKAKVLSAKDGRTQVSIKCEKMLESFRSNQAYRESPNGN